MGTTGKERRKNAETKALNNVEAIKNSVKKKADALKVSADSAALKGSNAIKAVHRKTESIIQDTKDTGNKIKQDLHKSR